MDVAIGNYLPLDCILLMEASLAFEFRCSSWKNRRARWESNPGRLFQSPTC